MQSQRDAVRERDRSLINYAYYEALHLRLAIEELARDGVEPARELLDKVMEIERTLRNLRRR